MNVYQIDLIHKENMPRKAHKNTSLVSSLESETDCLAHLSHPSLSAIRSKRIDTCLPSIKP